MKPPSSSLRATRTSSSSSTDSAGECVSTRVAVTIEANYLGRGKFGKRTVEERDKLVSRALGAESEGNGREAVNSIQTEENVIVLGELLALEVEIKAGQARLGRGSRHRPPEISSKFSVP